MVRSIEIKSGKTNVLKSLFECISPFIKDTNILISKECIKISTIDQSKTSLTYIRLDASKFESYKCDKTVIIGINTRLLFKTLKTSNRREMITLYMNSTDDDHLGIELSESESLSTRYYMIPLLSLDDKIIQISNIEFDSIINIPTVQFQQIIKNIQLIEGKIIDIKSVGKQFIFECVDGEAVFKTVFNEIDENLVKRCENNVDIHFIKNSDNIVQGRFKLNIILNFIKASHLCDNMNIFLLNDRPLILEYNIADLGIMRCMISVEN